MNNSKLPDDLSDAGNSNLFAEAFNAQFVFSRHDGWLSFNGKVWEYGDLEVIAAAKELTSNMSLEAELQFAIDSNSPDNKALVKHCKASRNKNKLLAMIDLSKPDMYIESEKLDADAHLLNTPDGMVDLSTGIIQPHDPLAYCTKITKHGPGDQGMDMWLDFLEMITCGDSELKEFLQQFAGMVLVGKVYSENLIIAYGSGANGKSTFFNAFASVLGNYAGLIAADVMMNTRNRNPFELSTIKNQRFLLASELEEGRLLSSSMLKQLCSTDSIRSQRKYHDPEDIVPKHSLVLFTNHLPKIGSTDHGTLRRLIAVPFDAVIPDNKKIANFTDILVENAGPAIIKWAIEGAIKYVAQGHKLILPDSVKNATAHYHEDNDWMKGFLDDICVVDPKYVVNAAQLYAEYRDRALQLGEFVRDNKGFVKELRNRGFVSKRTGQGVLWLGLGFSSQICAIQAGSNVIPMPTANGDAGESDE